MPAIINILPFYKKCAAFLICIGLAAFSFAASYIPAGDGDKPAKTKDSSSIFGFTPLKINTSFTLKAGPYYRHNPFEEEKKEPGFLTVTAAVTYKKGNTTYILPYKHKVFLSGAKSNLQAVNVKVNFNR